MLTGIAFGLLVGIIYFVRESFAKPQPPARASSDIPDTLDKGEDPKDIHWCCNCKHYRKVAEYEDIWKGLWREQSAPSREKIPCKIVLKTFEVWNAYYDKTDPKDRTLFPKGCSFFEKQAQSG